jgi:hypothetical protein
LGLGLILGLGLSLGLGLILGLGLSLGLGLCLGIGLGLGLGLGLCLGLGLGRGATSRASWLSRMYHKSFAEAYLARAGGPPGLTPYTPSTYVNLKKPQVLG